MATLRAEPGWALASGVPEVRQSSAHDCGIAALSMVLQSWGAPASSLPELRQELSSHTGGVAGSDEGVAAAALRDVARRHGLRAFLIQAELADLDRELAAGRPVLVGLEQRYTGRTLSHYEVVVGINAGTRRLFLFDPGHGARVDDFDGFTAEWTPTGRLAIVTSGWSATRTAAETSARGAPP